MVISIYDDIPTDAGKSVIRDKIELVKRLALLFPVDQKFLRLSQPPTPRMPSNTSLELTITQSNNVLRGDNRMD